MLWPSCTCDEAPSRTSVYRWYGEFNRGLNSLQDEFHEGRSKSVVVPETIDFVRQLILQDRHVTYREIETTLGISGTSIHSIYRINIWLSKKICSHWIPHNLSNAPKKVLCRLVERNAPKIQSRCFVNLRVWARKKIGVNCMGVSRWAKSNRSCSRTKHFKANDCLFFPEKWTCRNRSTRTTQNSKFWVLHNHLFARCLARNQENQPPKTDQSSPRQCELSLHIGSNNCIFEHSKHDLMSHPLYSLDLARNDFFLFPYVKNKMWGQRFSKPEEAVDAFRMHVLEIP